MTYICRVPDQLGVGRLCQWPDGNITLSAVATVPGVSEDDFLQLGMDCLDEIAHACGITPTIARQARSARILMTVFQLDGPGGVLADSELPCGQVYQCKQRYDLGESWTRKRLRQTMLHELLHALGLPHAPAGVRSVMASTLDETLDRLQEWEIQELRRRYGPRRSLPPPDDPRPTPAPAPAPTPGGNMNRDDLRIVLQRYLRAAQFVAGLTGTQVDDKIVAFVQEAISQDWVLDLLLLLLNRAGQPLTTESVASAMQQVRAA